MPLGSREFFDRVRSSTGPDGGLPLSRITGWEVFPFEADGLRVVALDEPVLPEPERDGERGLGCMRSPTATPASGCMLGGACRRSMNPALPWC
jgi:hypothetical protein